MQLKRELKRKKKKAPLSPSKGWWQLKNMLHLPLRWMLAWNSLLAWKKLADHEGLIEVEHTCS